MQTSRELKSDQLEPRPSRKRKRLWKRAIRALCVTVVVSAIAAELYARFKLGLGDPPLLMDDPEIEYLYKPSRTYHRFGHSVAINSHSMRSDDFPARKSNPNEFRVLVIGDSIVNGGPMTDQSELATELLRRRLSDHWQRPVIVGNISAGSWGPPNELAYLKRFGLFEADVVIVVLSSGDYGDVPPPPPRPPMTPQRKPVLALQEIVQSHGMDLIRYYFKGVEPPEQFNPTLEQIDESMEALRALLDLVSASHTRPAVALHMQRDEIMAHKPNPGYERIKTIAENRGVPVIELEKRFVDSLGQGKEPYRDYIHPNAQGQRLMADAFFDWIVGSQPKK
jgi:lysophospholipase L1-like esterase